MNDEEKQALCIKLAEWLVEQMPPEGLNFDDFRETIQGLMYCLYVQLRENLGSRTALMAMGEVLEVAAREAPGCGVHVDLLAIPKTGKARH